VIAWLDAIDPGLLYASVITVGELRLGVEALPAGKKRRDLESWLEKGLPEWFEALP
jgi:predicted nucleic acid-binding protein